MTGPWGWRLGYMHGPNLLGGGLLALLSCLFVIAILALLVWLIVRLARSGSHSAASVAAPVVSPAAPPPAAVVPQTDPVLETLRRRLAEGAITPEEFDQLREKLGV
jgi:uncharacterized membrane protein